MAKRVYTQSSASDRIKRTDAYAESVRKQFNATVNDILALKKSLPVLDDGVMYSFDGDTVAVRNKVAQLLKRLHASTLMTIQKGVEAEWETANKECDDFISQCFSKHLLESNMFRAWTSHNTDAMNAFVNRSDSGMNLSDRVWQSCRQLRDEMEIAMTVGIGEGQSASSMSQVVRKCLNDPDLMFRRFRYKKGEDSSGNPIWGRKWKKREIDPTTGKVHFIDYDKDSYIPKGAGANSRGVYKSAYKNAMRVTRTETNMAYRRADYVRWNQLSFVRGIHIELSNQHPDFDICDAMQGDYPKGFYFSGWHPHCFCYAVPIMVDEDEMKKVADEFLEGRHYTPKGEMIRDTPPNFKQWIEDNSKRLRQARSKPYWAKWNPDYVDAVKGVALEPKEDPLTIARKQREAEKLAHKAERDEKARELREQRNKQFAEDEKLAAQIMQEAQEYLMDVDVSRLQDLTIREQYTQMAEEAKKIQQQIADQKVLEKKYEGLIPDVHKWHQTYSMNAIEQAYNSVKGRIGYLSNYSWSQQQGFLNISILAEQDPIVKAGLEKYMVKVKVEAKIEVLAPQIAVYSKNAQNASIKIYSDTAVKAEELLKKKDVVGAEDALNMLKELEGAVSRYDSLMAYYKTTPSGMGRTKTVSKVGQCLIDAENLMNQGKVKDALKKIDEGEKTMAINLASNAQKAAKRQKQKEEAEAKKKQAEEDAKKAAEEANKKPNLMDATSNAELKKIMGDDYPVILQNYDDSIKRERFVDRGYLDPSTKAEIEKKLKNFFADPNIEIAHFTSPWALEGYFDKGILTNLQRDGSHVNCGVHSYENARRHYGHFAYDLHGHSGYGGSPIKVQKKDWLKDGDYYRCGVPVSKDKYTAMYRDASGYGDAMICIRRDRVATTFTVGNSYCQETIPSLTCDPKICSVDGKSIRRFLKNPTIESSHEEDYFECQLLPHKGGELTVKDFASITLKEFPENISPKELWKKFADEGVDIYYIKRGEQKATLYMKGKPQMTKEEARIELEKSKDEIDNWLKNRAELTNKNLSFDALQKSLKESDYLAAYEEAENIRATIKDLEKRAKAIERYIPDAKKWNKQFTMDELETAHTAIEKQISWLENKYPNRQDPDQLIGKFGRVMADLERDKKYNTWEVAKSALERRRDELVYQYRKDSIEVNLKEIKAFKTKDKAFLARVKDIEEKAAKEKWYEVDDLVKQAKEEMIALQTDGLQKVLKLGECSRIRFDSDEFNEAKRNVAVWFKAQSNSAAAMKKAWKEADAYMSKYAQDMWKNLSEEEKRVLWMYTDGSRYINEEMLGTYCFKMKSPWGDIRNGLTDANIITSVIEKSKALEESMWMQSAKSSDAFESMFGIDLRRVGDLSKIVGKEGSNNLFTSCHSASDGAFTKNVNTGAANDVIMSIYMPKGTKGIYMEPFASWGDAKRGLEGVDWKGTRRKEAPSNQVEYLLQRGSKFRITKAYVGVDGKWHIDVDLIEQKAMAALDDNISMQWRSTRQPNYVAK